MMKQLLPALFSLFIVQYGFSQLTFDAFDFGPEESFLAPGNIDILDVLQEIENGDSQQVYDLRDTEITYDKERLKSSKYWIDSTRSLSFSTKRDVKFTNCVFSFPTFFQDCSWKDFTVKNCDLKGGISIERTTITGVLTIKPQDEPKYISVLACTITGGIRLSGAERLRIFDSKLYADSSIVDELAVLFSFEDFMNRSNIFTKCIDLGQGSYDDVYIDACEIQSFAPQKCFSLDFEDCSINKLRISNNQLESINFYDATISRNIRIDSTTVSNYLFLDNVSFPGINTNIPWNIFKGRLIALKPTGFAGFKRPYQAIGMKQLSDLNAYNDYISTYNMMLTIYKDRGELASANGCYIEMKDVETSRLKYLYHEEGGLTNLFNWKLNQFLKFFSDYGTSPVKSLIISLYVVLGFAALYFFFYSDWDQINRTFLMRKHQKILSYFKTEQRMEDFYTDKHKKDFQTYEEYKREVVESKVEVPFFVRLIGKPLYQFALIKHKLNKWLYRRMEILKGKWVDLNQRQKVYRGTVVSVTLVLYMVYLICIRSMNSIVLSINTFSTLGFGDIPVHGVSRYIAILEGFLGWFLLSIFSVSLIGQLLQSA